MTHANSLSIKEVARVAGARDGHRRFRMQAVGRISSAVVPIEFTGCQDAQAAYEAAEKASFEAAKHDFERGILKLSPPLVKGGQGKSAKETKSSSDVACFCMVCGVIVLAVVLWLTYRGQI